MEFHCVICDIYGIYWECSDLINGISQKGKKERERGEGERERNKIVCACAGPTQCAANALELTVVPMLSSDSVGKISVADNSRQS